MPSTLAQSDVGSGAGRDKAMNRPREMGPDVVVTLFVKQVTVEWLGETEIQKGRGTDGAGFVHVSGVKGKGRWADAEASDDGLTTGIAGQPGTAEYSLQFIRYRTHPASRMGASPERERPGYCRSGQIAGVLQHQVSGIVVRRGIIVIVSAYQELTIVTCEAANPVEILRVPAGHAIQHRAEYLGGLLRHLQAGDIPAGADVRYRILSDSLLMRMPYQENRVSTSVICNWSLREIHG